MVNRLSDLFHEVAGNMAAVAGTSYTQSIGLAVDAIHQAFADGRKLLIFGNGGSSADAQHLACEFVGRFLTDRRALPAIALTSDQAILTAWSNDHSFDDVFARQIEALGKTGDVAFGISTSGTSRNVLNALARARELGLRTIGLSGSGGSMAPLCDVLLSVPLTATQRIQEVHLVTYHAICAAVEERLLADESGQRR